ncbi:MAG: hypothetical protein ACRDAU_10205 [Clostridium sp.]
MFRRKKKIDEYMRISNGVKVPGEKERIINLNERRKNGMKKKSILSVAMVAVVSGLVLFTNIGAGMGEEGESITSIKVYASESGSHNEAVELKKDTKTEIKGGFKVFGDTENGTGLISEGILLNIESDDLESLKLKANKGGFTQFTKGLPKDNEGVLFEEKNGDNGENTKKGEKIKLNEEQKARIYEEGKNELVLENVEGKATIEYVFSKDMRKGLDGGRGLSEVLNGVEIEIEATYKGEKVSKNILKLSVENDKIVAELK